jgi:peptidyl-Lys metalloendopeptidase
MKNLRWILGTIAMMAFLCSNVYALEVTVGVANDAMLIADTQQVVVNVTLTNTDNKPVRILKWALPSTEDQRLFDVRLDGKKVAYLGRIYKRPFPAISDYLKIRAGESVTRSVDITALYDFSISGNYSIQYKVGFVNLFHKDQAEKGKFERVSADQVNVWVDGRKVKVTEEAVEEVVQGTAGATFLPPLYTGKCTTDQISIIEGALAAAENLSDAAHSYLQTGSSNSVRYNTWFGAYDASRWNAVEYNFYMIHDALANKQINFDCKCKQPYFAYVYPNDPYKIYLCKVFWQVNQTGTDSQAGTIIHETSHFDVVAQTDDHVYGQSGAMALADSDPNLAIENADSHEYFAENTPYLP